MRVVLTVSEAEALRAAVRAIPWMPLDSESYEAVRSVSAKLDAAVERAERREVAEGEGADGGVDGRGY